MNIRKAVFAGALGIAVLAASGAQAADSIKVTISHKTSWDVIFPVMAKEQGFFKQQNLDVDFLFAAGGSESVQTAALGSVQIVVTASVHAVIAAYAKGAAVRIIGSQIVGSPDIYWYVKTDSPIKTPKQMDGKNVGYSRPGSVTHMLIQNFSKQHGIAPKLISGGGPPANRTMLMTDQLDVAWSASPFAMDIVQAGQARILFSGNDVTAAKDVVGRVTIVNADYLKEHRDVVRRYLIAYAKSVDYVYGPKHDDAVKWFADENKMDMAVTRAATKYFGTKADHALTPIKDLKAAMDQALEFGMIKEALTPAQLKDLVDIVYDPPKS
ncbi:MAG TPA: ABC transporter substrate-binding protein [Alphaproteobacteria bacterium]